MAEERYGPIFEQFTGRDVATLSADPEALKIGRRLFANYCATCHGSDGQGARSYPNLTDDDWLYGGEPDQIVTSITKGRKAAMPPMAAAIGNTDEAVRDMALYVQSLSRPDRVKDSQKAAAIERAKPKFAMCAACHGQDAKGNIMMGAPDLTDTTWLYGPRVEDIEYTIRHGRSGHMPAHENLLSKERIHVIAAYVYSLSRNADTAE